MLSLGEYSLTPSTEPRELLVQAVEDLLRDDGFSLPSSLASSDRDGAVKLSLRSVNASNQESLCAFSSTLTSALMKCFKSTRSSQKVQREKMWGWFHQLETSDSFQAT